MAELRSTIQSVYNVTDGNSMVAYNLVVDHQVHAGALMSSDDQIVVQLNKTVGDVVEQLAFNSDTLTAAYATSGSTGLVWNISGTTALLKCASGAAWKNEDIIISATINNIVVDKERISYSSSTPILELSNDIGSLMYSADGATKLKNDEVATTSATIYVNGNAVPTAQVQFNWNIIDGVGTSSANTVTVSAINLNAFKAQAVCTATFNGGSYQKSFDVMRNTQGVNGKPGTDGEPGADANVIEVFDIYFWRDLETAKTDILPSVPSDRSSIADSDTVAKDNWTTKIPTKATNRLIYHSVVTWTKKGTTTETLTWVVTNPNLILAYDSTNMQSPESYAQYLSLTNFDQNDALGWANGKLIIKAEYIQSKGILVKNGEDVVFAAGGDGEYAHSAKIGGFTVDKNSLYNGTTDDSLIFLSTGRSEKYTIAGYNNVSNLMIKAGSNFGVTKDGTVYAGAAFITGTVNAEKGKIGGWTIDSQGLTYGNTVGVYGANTWFYADTDGFPTEQAWIQRSASSPDSNLRFWAGVYSKQGVSNPILADGNYLHFCVTNNGTLYADQAFISGTIKAKGGTIGHYKITELGLEDTSTAINIVNLIEESDTYVSTDKYQVTDYYLTQNLIKDQQYTIWIYGDIPANCHFSMFINLDEAAAAQLTYNKNSKYSYGTFYYTGQTFTYNKRIFIYQRTGSAEITGSTGSNKPVKIWKIVLAKGNYPSNYVLKSPNFTIESNGTVALSGIINADTGRIGAWALNADGFYSDACRIVGQVTKPDGTILNEGGISFYNSSHSLVAQLGSTIEAQSISCRGLLSGNSLNIKENIHGDALFADSYLDCAIFKSSGKQYAHLSKATSTTSLTIGLYNNSNNTLQYTLGAALDYDYTVTYYVHAAFPAGETVAQGTFIIKAGQTTGTVACNVKNWFWGVDDVGFNAGTWTKTTYVYRTQTSEKIWYFDASVQFKSSVQFHGTIYDKSGNEVTLSSRLSKTNIQSFNNQHNILFDNLQPRQFEYINGTSHRLHYGMILDEVATALQKADLTTQECAAYCLIDQSKPDGEGGLRYSEFIALNTWQIQLLKPRVSDLEQRCIILEARVKELEEKYENIQ